MAQIGSRAVCAERGLAEDVDSDSGERGGSARQRLAGEGRLDQQPQPQPQPQNKAESELRTSGHFRSLERFAIPTGPVDNEKISLGEEEKRRERETERR